MYKTDLAVKDLRECEERLGGEQLLKTSVTHVR